MESVLPGLLIALVAALYASVGLAGASGYLAILALFGVAPVEMKGAALLLNSLVSLIGTWVFRGNTRDRLGRLAAITLPSVPLAFLGGAIRLPPGIYLPLVGLILLASAARLARQSASQEEDGPAGRPSLAGMVVLGMGIGFASGLTGTGGGIFLLPALQMLGWADPRGAASLAAPFVLVTSLAGLGGFLWSSHDLPGGLVLWAPAAMLGGYVGSRLGRDRLDPRVLRGILVVLLVAAGLKLLVS